MFQNDEVLHTVTIPSVIVNVQTQRLSWPPSCRFFHGDWDGLTDAVDCKEKYSYCFLLSSV